MEGSLITTNQIMCVRVCATQLKCWEADIKYVCSSDTVQCHD